MGASANKGLFTKRQIESFWTRVDLPDGCWLWVGSKHHFGHGKVSIGQKTDRAHRVAWQMFYGPIPDGLCVLHKCDVPNCINPNHLFLGTRGDNNKDRSRKGRTVSVIGENSPSSKLKNEDILAIRELYQTGNFTQREIAEFYGVCDVLISRIVRKKIWKHLD